MVSHQLQVRCRPVKVRRSETDVLPLSHQNNCTTAVATSTAATSTCTRSLLQTHAYVLCDSMLADMLFGMQQLMHTRNACKNDKKAKTTIKTPVGLWSCSKSVRCFGRPVCKALKVREGSLKHVKKQMYVQGSRGINRLTQDLLEM